MLNTQSTTLLHKGEFTELTLRISADGRRIVRKSSFYPGSEKLVDEANFIIESLPDSARLYFPKIIAQKPNYTPGEEYYYEMPYYVGQLLREKIVNGPDDLSLAVKDVRRTLSILKEHLYSAKAAELPESFMQKHYIDRITSRLSKYADLKESSTQGNTLTNDLLEAQVEEFFANIVSRRTVTINSKEMLTPLEILRRAETDNRLKQLVLPPLGSMSMIHGDPHLGNVMILDNPPTLLFVDPNGFHTGGDIAYDLGKFILSLDYLDLLLEKELIYPQIAWNNGSIRIGELRVFKVPAKAQKLERSFETVIREVLPEVFADIIEHDPKLIDRSIFAASLHAFACAHTFIPTKNKDAAIPLLIYFMERANSQLERLQSSLEQGVSE